MFGTPPTRIAELSRPDYDRELTEFARLEFPRESLAYIQSQAKAVEPDDEHPRPHRLLGFLRFRAKVNDRAPEPESA